MTQPKLRFKEFKTQDNNWKQVVFSNIFTRIKEKNKDLKYSNNLTISAEYGLINEREFFNKKISAKNTSNYYILKKGDFAYNKSYSKGYKAGVIKMLDRYKNGLVSSLYICFKITNKNQLNNIYAQHFFNSLILDRQLLNIAQEGARNHGLLNININEFFNLKLNIPTLEEQEKIGDFLTLIDKKITLLENQKSKLEDYKKTLSTKLLTQVIRFKEFTDDWQTVKLGDIAHIKTGKLNANAMVESGKYRFYTCAKEHFYIDNYEYNEEVLLISGNGANVGYIHYYNGKFNAYQRTYILSNIYKYHNILFVKCVLDHFLPKRIEEEKNGGNTPYIVIGTLQDFKISLPTIEEQEKISQVLSNIDKLITQKQIHLTQTKKYKAYLLQNMFV